MRIFLVYIVALMVFYDLSIHLIYLIKKEDFFLKRKIHYWPHWDGQKYQIFWSVFWGTALILLLLYIFL